MLLAGSTKLHHFQYDKPGTPWLTMDHPIIAAIYNPHSATILTAGGGTLKIWEARYPIISNYLLISIELV